MNQTATLLAPSRSAASPAVALADWAVLAKVRILMMELICIIAGFMLAGPTDCTPLLLIATLLGTGLVAASASALNQVIERDLDGLMIRTQDRPLPAGRMTVSQAALFATVTGVSGATLLLVGTPLRAALLGALCWLLYVVVYTPLKTRSTLNTAVGAVSGALPILLGWVAAGGALDATAWGLFGVLALWQYPHFMAIAWLCRDDYQAAGYKMASTVDSTGRHASWLAIIGAVTLLPTVLLPVASANTIAGQVSYAVVALALTLVYLASSIHFARRPDERRSRKLLRVSLLYLPLWLVSLVLLSL